MTRHTQQRNRKRPKVSPQRKSAQGPRPQSKLPEDVDDREHRAFVARARIREDQDHRDPGERWDEQRGLLER